MLVDEGESAALVVWGGRVSFEIASMGGVVRMSRCRDLMGKQRRLGARRRERGCCLVSAIVYEGTFAVGRAVTTSLKKRFKSHAWLEVEWKKGCSR